MVKSLLGLLLPILALLTTGLAPAQSPVRIGILVPDLGRAQTQAIRGLGQELKRLGYQEGKNFVFDLRNAKGDRGALQPAAADLAARNSALIFATGTRATQAASSATKELPIVFVHPGDPVALGIVKETADAPKNLTGVAAYAAATTEIRLKLLKEIMPGLRQIYVFYDTNNNYSRENFAVAEAAAKKLGVRVSANGVKSVEELKSTFNGLSAESGTAVFHVADDLVESEAEFIFDTARKKKLPTMFNEERWAIAGAMAAQGPSFLEMGRRAAGLIDKILKGQKPAGLPIERATKFDLTINYRTGNFIGFHFTPEILKKADKIIR